MNTNAKINALITKTQVNDFSPVNYSVAIWGKGQWSRKTKLFASENSAISFCNNYGYELVEVKPNPDYPGWGQNKYQLVYLEWDQESVHFQTYQSAKKFVESRLNELWEAYNSEIPELQF